MVLGAVLAAALLSAISIPLDRPGVGWLIGVLAGTAALGVAVWSARSSAVTGAPEQRAVTGTPGERAVTGAPEQRARTGVPTLTAARLIWTVATVALVGVGTVRAAGWLFVLCLLTAGMTAALAVADGRSTRGLLLSLLIPPVAVFRSVPWAATGLGRRQPAAAATLDATPDATPEARPVHAGRVLGTVAVSIGLLVVFGALFASADPAFARLLSQLLPEASLADTVRWSFLTCAVGAGLLGAAYVLTRPPDLTGLDGREPRRVHRWEWAVPVLLLDLLFAMFVLVQVTVLFGGDDHVVRTSGLTYAEYARGGFWQLLVVSALTLGVLAGAARWAPRAGRTDQLLIRVLLGFLALLSLVVVASALCRMNVYTEAYGASRLRLLVTVCELWIGLLFVLVLAAGVRLRAAWLARVALGGAVLALLGLAAVNPDRLIADQNIARYEQTGRLDIWYLSQLSADAAPALDRLPGPLRDCALVDIAQRLGSDDWREANSGRAAARRLLAANPVTPVGYGDCADGRSWR